MMSVIISDTVVVIIIIIRLTSRTVLVGKTKPFGANDRNRQQGSRAESSQAPSRLMLVTGLRLFSVSVSLLLRWTEIERYTESERSKERQSERERERELKRE